MTIWLIPIPKRMGAAGRLPSEGWQHSAFIKRISYVDLNNTSQNATGLTSDVTNAAFYDLSLGSSADSNWQEYFYFGGPGLTSLTDQQKQQTMLTMVNNHRGALVPEFVLAEIFQEGGQGASYVNGYLYNSFYRQSDAPWAQPSNNSDGIMQVTSASGFHNHTYTNDQTGYDYAITDGCGYLLANYNTYGTTWQSALHYNTGPSSLYIYKGLNAGNRQYLAGISSNCAIWYRRCMGFRIPHWPTNSIRHSKY